MLPFNGYKLVLGLVLGITAKIIAHEVPTADEIKALIEALASIGFTLAGIGAVHKPIKLADKALND